MAIRQEEEKSSYTASGATMSVFCGSTLFMRLARHCAIKQITLWAIVLLALPVLIVPQPISAEESYSVEPWLFMGSVNGQTDDDGSRAAKQVDLRRQSRFDVEVAVFALMHFSEFRTARAQGIMDALLDQQDFRAIIEQGLLRSPHDCPPLYRNICQRALSGDSMILDAFRVERDDYYEFVREDPYGLESVLRAEVIEAQTLSYQLFADDELNKARVLIFYNRARQQCEENTNSRGEALTQSQEEHACEERNRRRNWLDANYCYAIERRQWLECTSGSPEGTAIGSVPSTLDRDDTLSQLNLEQHAMILVLTCWAEQSAILGMPLSAADNGVSEFSISVDEDGAITLNGQVIETRYKGHAVNGHLRFAAAAVPDIITGLSEQAAMGRAMPGVGQDDVDTIDQIQSFFTVLMLAGRDRVMFADVQDQEIIFGDVQGQNLTNQSQATCW